MSYGSREFNYELVDIWAKYPDEWTRLNVPGIAIDSQDRVYALSRTENPVTIFNSEGKLLKSWGEGIFTRPHGIHVSYDGFVYCTDDLDHTVRKFTFDGKLVMTLGVKGKASNTGYLNRGNAVEDVKTISHAAGPFNRPTGVFVSSSGEIYVSDGYGNSRIHKFSPEGKLLSSWGEPGNGPGQFVIPHHIWVDGQERVWVADRENNRVQIFDTNGKFLNQWIIKGGAGMLSIKNEEIVYVSGWWMSIFTIDGKLLAEIGKLKEEDRRLGPFGGHGMAVDSQGNIYFGNLAHTPEGVKTGPNTLFKYANVNR
jgi:DNA-binding beta-propeller fold protein YncE